MPNPLVVYFLAGSLGLLEVSRPIRIFRYAASSSTSNTSVACGGITPPAPRAP